MLFLSSRLDYCNVLNLGLNQLSLSFAACSELSCQTFNRYKGERAYYSCVNQTALVTYTIQNSLQSVIVCFQGCAWSIT